MDDDALLVGGLVILMSIAFAVIVWLRSREASTGGADRPTVSHDRAPPTGSTETCHVCMKPKPRGRTSFFDEETSLRAWWRRCPECHARYCEDHKGLLWISDEFGTALRCLECEHTWLPGFHHQTRYGMLWDWIAAWSRGRRG
jgi:hypothetical protein